MTDEPPPFGDARVGDLLEFGRIMHAEMAALMTAARRGSPVREASLYTTTYPCHECMRLIIGAGISRVVYIDPYPKSLVPELYGLHLEGSRLAGKKIKVEPFVGVAPRLVPKVFAQVKARVRDLRGKYEDWNGEESAYFGTEDRYADSTILQEARVGEVLDGHLKLLAQKTDAASTDSTSSVPTEE